MSLREYIIANLCDGHESGLITLKAGDLADTVVEAVMAFLVGGDPSSWATLADFVKDASADADGTGPDGVQV